MNNKQKLVYLSLIALTIIGILSGASYAYFSIENKIGNETVIESGTMALTFTDGSTITADKLIPGEYIEKTFSVRNTGTVRTNYDIYLSEVVNTFVNQSDLVYEIISSNGYNTINQIQVPNTETKIINNYPIDPLQEHTYTLRITYKLTNEVQNDNMGRTFIAKINVNEYNSNNSETYIKLIDSSNNLLDKQVITNNTDYYYNLNNYDLTNSTNIYCNNGGIPTIENNILKVSEVTSETNCRISNSINTTINNLPNTKTGIVMTNNETVSPQLQIGSKKDVVLDLNNNTIYGTNHGLYVPENSNVSINNGSIISNNTTNASGICNNGTVLLENVYIEGPYGLACFVNNNASAELNNVEIKSRTYSAIHTNESFNSTININDGVLNGNGTAIYNSGSGLINITSGSFKSTNSLAINNNSGTVNISGGTFNSGDKTINNNTGTINITGGTFESTNSQTVYNNGTININGGSFVSNNKVIENYGTLNINQSDKPIYISSKSTTLNTAIMNISILNIEANKADKCTSNSSDTTSGLCVYGVNINGTGVNANVGLINNGIAYIDGGSYYGGCQGINNDGDNTLYIKNAYINSLNIGIFMGSTGKTDTKTYVCSTNINSTIYDFNGYDGKLYFTSDVIFSDGTNIPNASIKNSLYERIDQCPSWPTE